MSSAVNDAQVTGESRQEPAGQPGNSRNAWADRLHALKNVPPGTYTLVAWHELYGPTEQSVTVAASQEQKVNVAVKAAAGSD